MRNSKATAAITVPPSVWAALQISAIDPVLWEVRNGEAMLTADVPRRSVDDVAGMLAPLLKGKRIRWSAVSANAREAWGQMR